MTKSQILEAIRLMRTQERLEVMEFTLRLIREEMPQMAVGEQVHQLSLKDAAECVRSYYEEGGELTEFIDRCQEDFYEYKDYA
jgi:hypothetical protein